MDPKTTILVRSERVLEAKHPFIIVVSKRVCSRAVDRNYLKRVVREVMRAVTIPPSVRVTVRFVTVHKPFDFQEIQKTLLNQLKKAIEVT